MKKNVVYYFLVFLYISVISVPVILPFFHKGYFPTHDGEWAVVRLSDMFRELRDLQIPPRFSGNLNFGYGYPLFNFAYPLPYYLGIVLHVLKFNFVDAIKLLFAISIPLSGIGMFFASRLLFKKTIAGIISSTLFIYLPYRLVDLYVRGSLGESLAFVFFPAIFFCIVKILDKGSRVWMGIGGILYGCLIMTHNIMAVYFTVMIMFFIVGHSYFTKSENLIKVFFTLSYGLLLSAFFWFPALYEKRFILLSVTPIADRSINFVSFPQLIIPSWAYGVPGNADSFTFQLGIPQVLAGITAIFLLFYAMYRKKQMLEKKTIYIALILCGIFFVFSIFLFRFSTPLWKLPLVSEINYPWTLLLPLGFLLNLLAGLLAENKYTLIVARVACVLAFILIIPYAKPQYYVDRGDNFYVTNDATTTSSHEYMPLWVKTIPYQRATEKVEILKGRGTIENLAFSSKEINFIAHLQKKSYIRVNTIYYPGWVGKDIFISRNNNLGVMEFWLEKGFRPVNLKFTETPIRLISDIVSLASFVLLIFFFFIKICFPKK